MCSIRPRSRARRPIEACLCATRRRPACPATAHAWPARAERQRRRPAGHQRSRHQRVRARCTRALLTPPSTRAGLPVSRVGARRAHGHAAGAEQAAAAPSSARTPAMRGALVRLAQSSRAGPARSPLPRALPPHAAAHAPSTSAQRSLHPSTRSAPSHPRPPCGCACSWHQRSCHQRSRHQRSKPAACALLTPPSACAQVLPVRPDAGSAARMGSHTVSAHMPRAVWSCPVVHK